MTCQSGAHHKGCLLLTDARLSTELVGLDMFLHYGSHPALQAAAAQVAERYPQGIDMLLNNAGMQEPIGRAVNTYAAMSLPALPCPALPNDNLSSISHSCCCLLMQYCFMLKCEFTGFKSMQCTWERCTTVKYIWMRSTLKAEHLFNICAPHCVPHTTYLAVCASL